MRHRRKFRWLWYIFAGGFFGLEGYARYTREREVPTLSRTVWFLRDLHPVFKVVTLILTVWLVFHLGMGEDAEDLVDWLDDEHEHL